jgi:c(7)-type cytochrome triheme protein
MPARGGNTALSDSEVAAAVDYVLASVKGAPAPAREEPKQAPKPSPAVATGDAGRLEAKAESKPGAAAVTPAPGSQAVAIAGASPADVNAFNRLLKPVGKRNPPPAEDGIHDPTNDGTHALLPPMAAYGDLPKSLAGNRVNWVTAIAQKKINPRWDRNDEKAEAMVMDMNIVREVKGSMPDVVYPHKQHTEWLDCSNCHPAIFVPQKGANSISMAAILLGEKCGVCHGKVAFPVSECRLCHSKKKEMPRAQATATGK